MNKSKITAVIMILWGGGIVISDFLRNKNIDSSTYGEGYKTGQSIGVVFGIILFFVGLFMLVKKKKLS